jgi:uncharacterized membrane protein YkoI
MAHRFTRFMASSMPIAGALVAGAALVGSLSAQQPAQQEPKYKRDLPAALMKRATVSEEQAAKTALAAMPNATIKAVELEDENGRLIYSYELKVPGHSGIEEVNVNAKTGAVVNTEHETPATERGEAKQEAAAKKKG